MVETFGPIAAFPLRMLRKQEMQPDFMELLGHDEQDKPRPRITGYADVCRLLGVKREKPQERNFKIIGEKDKHPPFMRPHEHKLTEEAPEKEEEKRQIETVTCRDR